MEPAIYPASIRYWVLLPVSGRHFGEFKFGKWHDPGIRPINLTVRYVSSPGIDMDTTVTVKIEPELAYQLDMHFGSQANQLEISLKSDIGLSATAWVYGQRGWTN